MGREVSPEAHQYFKVVQGRDSSGVKEEKPGECGAQEAKEELTCRK